MANLVKKTIELDEDLIRKVRRVFDVKTDKEAVNQALRFVADESEIIDIHTALAGGLDFEPLFR